MNTKNILKKLLVSSELESHLENIPDNLGPSGWDPWGYNRQSAMIGAAALKLLYDHYFRVEPYGLENIPKNGRVLVVGNHSGQLPFDGTQIGMAMATNPHGPRAPRAMIERFVPMVPFVGNWLNQVGAVIGDPVNCIRMLEREEAVIVFPEGVRGSGKLFRHRYKLQRFGTGFMHIAMNTGAPIVPVGVVGCEETMPSIANLKPLARVLALPYIPMTLPFPLPAKVILHFGKPMVFQGDVDWEETVNENVEAVKKEIASLVSLGLEKRKGWF